MPRTGRLFRIHHVTRLACVALAAATIPIVVVAPAFAARPTRGATYDTGFLPTANTNVRLQVGRRGSEFDDVWLIMSVRCSNDRKGFEGLLWTRGVEQPTRVPIGRNGSFSAMFTTAPDKLDLFTVSEQYWVSGRFTRRGKVAELVVRARAVGEAGTVCDSGNRHANARRSSRPV